MDINDIDGSDPIWPITRFGDLDEGSVSAVLAARSIPMEVIELARRLDVMTVAVLGKDR